MDISKPISNRTRIIIELKTIDDLDLMDRFVHSSTEKALKTRMFNLNVNLRISSRNNIFNRYLYFVDERWSSGLRHYVNGEIKVAIIDHLYGDKRLIP